MEIAAPTTNGQLLTTKKLVKQYGGRRVVDGVSVADDHVERRRLARAVRAEQPDDFTRAHGDGHVVHHPAAVILLHQFFRGEQRPVR